MKRIDSKHKIVFSLITFWNLETTIYLQNTFKGGKI